MQNANNISNSELSKRAVKAGVYYVVTQIIVRGLTFFATPLYTRMLSTEQFGQIRVYESWALIFVVALSLGLYRSLERAIHDYREKFDAYVSSVQFVAYASITFFFIIFTVFYDKVERLLNLNPLLFILLFLYVISYTGTLFFMYSERQKMEYRRVAVFTAVTMVPAVFLSVGLLYFGNLNNCANFLVELRMIGYLGPQIIGGLVVIYMMLRRGGEYGNREFWKYGLLYSLPLVPNQLSLQVMNQSDKIMVQMMTGFGNAGIFSLATTISYILLILFDAAWGAWLPWLYTKMSNGEGSQAVKPWIRLSCLFALMSFSMTLIAPEVVLIMGGKGYEQSAYLLAPMLTGILFNFYSNIYSAGQNYYKKTYFVAIGTIIAMLINVGLNYIFIKKTGYGAAAYTTAFSYMCLLIIQAILEKKVTGFRLVPLKYMLIIAAAIIFIETGAVLLFGITWIVRWLIAAIIGILSLIYLFRRTKLGATL